MKRIKLIKPEEEENFYSEESRDTFVEEDELSPTEAAFMKGWEEAS